MSAFGFVPLQSTETDFRVNRTSRVTAGGKSLFHQWVQRGVFRGTLEWFGNEGAL